MNKKELKHLAEAHYFTGQKLSDEQYNELRESEYSHVIAIRSKFDELLQEALPEEVSHKLPDAYAKRKHSGFHVGVDKNAADHLIDTVEDHFNLGITNTSTRKYLSVNIEELKSFILNHIDDEGVDKVTSEHAHNIVDKQGADVYDVMKGLYSLGS
jgi:hypothetical protein